VVDHLVGRILDLFDIEHSGLATRWNGLADDFARQKVAALQDADPADLA
jgi:hypothetical protein